MQYVLFILSGLICQVVCSWPFKAAWCFQYSFNILRDLVGFPAAHHAWVRSRSCACIHTEYCTVLNRLQRKYTKPCLSGIAIVVRILDFDRCVLCISCKFEWMCSWFLWSLLCCRLQERTYSLWGYLMKNMADFISPMYKKEYELTSPVLIPNTSPQCYK